MRDKCDINTIRNLINELNMYTKAYDEGNPLISDKEWDDLYFQLFRLENLTKIIFEDSPTQRINYQVVNQLNKVEHNHPMLSLAKTKDLQDIKDMFKDNEFFMMAKMDGLTCSLKYENGYLVGAETRGNGIIGEDILHNALVIQSIPNRITYLEPLIIDGEIISTVENFENFKNEYKNPRNFASGSIRLLDSQECKRRGLDFIAWDAPIGLEHLPTLKEKIQFLNDLSFRVVPGGLQEGFTLEELVSQMQDMCRQISYPIDGIVFKFNNCEKYNSMGRTDHHFKGGIAYKFYDEEYETTLKDIEWTMGRTGVLTPTAIFETIEIDGTDISRASLHNISVMDELSGGFQRIGDKLMIYKANQIIPQVSSWEHQGEFSEETHLCLPEKCPYCDGETIIKQEVDSKMLYCNNPQCEGKLVNKIEHFFGKKGLDAKGISKATIEKLIDWGWISRASDMFTLSTHAEEWKNIQGFGEKSVSNILQSIETCRNCIFESVISAAGIPLIGRTVARDLSKRFKSYSDFREAIKTNFDFTKFGGYGYEMHKALTTFDYSELDYIVENYLNIQDDINEEKVQVLEGLTFCVTGKVKIWKNRDELSSFIESLGGKVTGSVTKNTNYLINNDVESTSAKNKKAKELNIKIIGEQAFMDLFDIEK